MSGGDTGAEDTLESDADFLAYQAKASSVAGELFGLWDYDPDDMLNGVKTNRKRRRTSKRTGKAASAGRDGGDAPGGGGAAEDGDGNGGGDDDDDADKLVPDFVSRAEADTEDDLADDEEAPTTDEGRELSVVNETTIPGLVPATPHIFMKNIVMVCTTGQLINLSWVMQHSTRFGFSRNEKRFAATTFRCMSPRSSTLAFSSGKFVNTGAQQIEDSRLSIERMIAIIRDLRDENGVAPYASLRVRTVSVPNVVGSTRVPFRINLRALARYDFVRYVSDEFVGAIVTVSQISTARRDLNTKALVFESGNLVIMGARSRDHVASVYKLIYQYIARAAVQDELPIAMRVTKSQRRRAESDQRKIAALPAGAKNVIAISPSFQADEFQRVNSGRETARQALARERVATGTGDLSNVNKRQHNLIALASMQTHVDGRDRHRRDESQQALLLEASAASDKPTGLELLLGGGAAKKHRIALIDKDEQRTLAIGKN